MRYKVALVYSYIAKHNSAVVKYKVTLQDINSQLLQINSQLWNIQLHYKTQCCNYKIN